MIKPITLRLRNAELLAKARATLIRAGRGDELKRAHAAAVMRQARATVARPKEKWRVLHRGMMRAARLVAGDTVTRGPGERRRGMIEKRWRRLGSKSNETGLAIREIACERFVPMRAD
jgi:hypothetical protein